MSADMDIEQRLAAAAQAVREHQVATQRCSDLRRREDQINAEIATLGAAHDVELREVHQLEHVSLTRVLASLRGTREDALRREHAQADAARYRVNEAQARLTAVADELRAAQERLDHLSTAADDYSAALAEKERHLTDSNDPRRATLLGLADERGRLNAEIAAMNNAQEDAGEARAALQNVQDVLGSARGWNTYDAFFGGGLLADMEEHSKLDQAAQAAAEADRRMAVLRTELTDIRQADSPSGPLDISAATKFVDMWFGNIFTDLAVRDRITQAQQNVAQCLSVVSDVQGQLKARSAQAQARLAAIEEERRDLVTR